MATSRGTLTAVTANASSSSVGSLPDALRVDLAAAGLLPPLPRAFLGGGDRDLLAAPGLFARGPPPAAAARLPRRRRPRPARAAALSRPRPAAGDAARVHGRWCRPRGRQVPRRAGVGAPPQQPFIRQL